MKKILYFLLLILFLGTIICCSKKVTTVINLSDDLVFEYDEEIALYDLISITDGKIKTDNYSLDTEAVGIKNIEFEYYDSNEKVNKYSFPIEIIDITSPIVFNQSKYYAEKGKDINIIDSLIYGDNADRNVDCIIEGYYNIDEVGEYNLKIIATDSSNNITKKDITLVVVDKFDASNYEMEPLYLADAIKTYKQENTMIGIDISSWQDSVDFKKVKESGIEFVIIRIGYGHDNDYKNVLDKNFFVNYDGAKDAGLQIGLYFYSYAGNVKDSVDQAKWIIEQLNGRKLDLPIAFDWEIWSNFNDYKINFTDLNNVAKAFFEELENSGYQGMIYGSLNYLENVWNLPKYKTWLAHYSSSTSYSKDFYIWQLSSLGIVDGIDGYVDLNILYK